MGARGDAMGNRRLARYVEAPALGRSLWIRKSQQEAGQAIGQRRLADAAQTREQPGMMHPPRCQLAQQRLFGTLMAPEIGAPARMMFALARILAIIAHATPASGATSRQISSATAA